MPIARTREYIISKLTQCGDLSYNDMVDLLYSIAFLYEVGGGGGATFNEYDENDLIYNSGHVYLPLLMTGSQFPSSMMVVNNATGEKRSVYPAYQSDGLSPEGIFDQFFVDGAGVMVPQKVYVGFTGVPVSGVAPIITTNLPANKEVVQGDQLDLSVVATGATSYQWKKNGVPIAGQTTPNLAVADFNALKEGSYTCDVINTAGTTASSACVVSNDEGIKFYNATQVNDLGVPSPGGRSMTVDDGVYIRVAPFDTFIRIRSAATNINIKQGGIDNLVLFNNGVSSAVAGGNVNNVKAAPFVDPMFLYNNN